MNKTRKLLGFFLVFIILNLTHTTWSQEKTPEETPQKNTEITAPKDTISTKINVSKEEIINESQKKLDWSMTFLNIALAAMGVLCALIVVLVIIGGSLGFGEIKHIRQIRDKVEEYKKSIEKVVEKTKADAVYIKHTKGEISLVVDWLNNNKKELQNLTEDITLSTLKSIVRPLTENDLQKVYDLKDRVKFLDKLGVSSKLAEYSLKALSYFEQGKYELALELYNLLLEEKPEDSLFLFGKAITLSQLNQYKDAIDIFKKVIEFEPKEYLDEAWNNMGDSYLRLTPPELNEAKKCFDKAIEINPKCAEAWVNRAIIHSLRREKVQMLENLKEAFRIAPNLKSKIKKDEDFKRYWDDSDFRKLTS